MQNCWKDRPCLFPQHGPGRKHERLLAWCSGARRRRTLRYDALDLIDVPWRQSGHRTISVSTRAGVARLDELIGPKS